MIRALIGVVVGTFLLAPVEAQGYFVARSFPGPACESTITADVDHDGHTDVVCETESPTSSVASLIVTWLGDGDGNLTATEFVDVDFIVTDLAAADFDQDGNVDLVGVGSFYTPGIPYVVVWRGQGDGRFEFDTNLGGAGDDPVLVEVGDFNRDERPDIVVLNEDRGPGVESLSVFLQYSTGGFREPSRLYPSGERPTGLAVGDFNGDALLDIITLTEDSWGGNFERRFESWLGLGNGSFTTRVQIAPFVPGTPSDVSAGDINLDGVDDIAMSIDRETWVGRSYGGGFNFDAFEWVSTPTLVDLTDDGFPDILAVAGNSVMRNDGTGWFGPPEALPGVGWANAATDLDGDRSVDIVGSHTDALTVISNRGGGEFATADQFPGGYQTSEQADFNRDGFVDFVTGNSDGIDVLLNDGRGQFSPAGSYMSDHWVWNLAVSDLDGDDLVDVATSGGRQVSILVGDGEGGLTLRQEVELSHDGPLAVADLDLDGWNDLVVIDESGNGVTVLLGQGDGLFAEDGRYFAGYFPSDLALGEFNGDGIPDLVTVSHQIPRVFIILGNGSGGFSTQWRGYRLADSTYTAQVIIADFNRDGDDDFAVASESATVFLGEGNGRFVESGNYAGLQSSRSIATGDVDADGHLDLALGGINVVKILQGDGTGSFADPSGYSPTNGFIRNVHLARLDGDLRLDLAIVDGFVLGTMLQIDASQISAAIDVKPDSYPNSINVFSRGVIPVAILGSGTFDVAEIDVPTLAFGPTLAPIAHLDGHPQDVNNDGIIDLLLHFRTRDTGISCGDESATLTGQTLNGHTIENTDSIQTVGCRGTGWPSIRVRDKDRFDTSSRDVPVSIERK